MIQPEVWKKKMYQMFMDKDVGLLTSASGFMLGILENGTFPVSEWWEIVPAVAQVLHNMVQGDCPDHYEYYHVPAPWLQTKLLRILQFFPVQMLERDMDTLGRVNHVLQNILTRPAAQRAPPPPGTTMKKRCKADAERQNRSNAEHSILFEAMNLMIHLEDRCDPETTRTASGLLGAFISSTDPNIRYLGLETMARLATNPGTHTHLERYKDLILEKMHEPDISIRRQALNLLYALCRPENWQQIVEELLEILNHSDALLQEELVLKIAILAEKNAPNFGYYVDVVFKMLANAPDSVGDDVWYRVVQVVTGFAEGMSDGEKRKLQQHAAWKSFQNLAGEKGRVPHETLVKLGAYLIGEFGHLLPQDVPARKKFDVLYKHYSRSSQHTKAIIVLASAKLLNAMPEALKQDVLPFMEDLQEAQDVELQQRSCEMLQLLRDEEFLDHVLCPMPPYADRVQMNNPLIQRLKFQSKNRAMTRAQLEEAAKSEGGVYKPGSNTSGRGLSREDGDFGDGLGMPGGGGRRSGGNESDSDSSDSSGSGRGGSPKGGAGQRPNELWQQLCIMPQGRFYSSRSLVLELKQEYQGGQGKITIMFMNQSQEPIGNIRVQLPEVPFMRIQQFSEPPQMLAPGQQAPHHIQVMCMKPFLQPAKYLLEYREARGEAMQCPFMLPAVMTKFVTPTEVQMQQFQQFFESMAGPPKENVVMGQAKVPPNEWPNYLTKGFNLFMLRESNAQNTFAAGTLNTGTPDPNQQGKMMTIPVLVRLEYNPPQNMVRMTTRTQHPEVTQALAKIMETYLVVPGAPQNGAPAGQSPGGYR